MGQVERSSLAGLHVIPVMQGETHISCEPNDVLTSILGSCIAACMWDPEARVGGLTHFLLPGTGQSGRNMMKYGVHAMELLVNGLLRAGGDRHRFKVRLLGGAKMYDGAMDIGAENAHFAKWYVANEGFDLVDHSLGGRQGRNVRFWPVSGNVECYLLDRTEAAAAPLAASRPMRTPVATHAAEGEVDLF